MVGKLGLVGAVAVAWLLTFVVMGGDVMPALSGHHDDPAASAPLTPTATYPSRSSSNVPAPGSTPPATPGDTTGSPASQAGGAASAEAAARTAPLAGQTLQARPKPRRSPPAVVEFRMATFNVLGSSHTRKGTKRAQKASGSARMARATSYVIDNDITLVGFQEMQPDQRSAFLRSAGGRYGLYPGGSTLDGDNSIAWRLDTWELVKPGSVPIPYFGGHARNMPVLLLRNKATGITIYATNFHNPADTREYGKQGKWRAAAKAREVTLFNELKDDGFPVFVTGDMNETQSWFCAVAGPGDLKAAAGGEGGRAGCSVAGGYRIDWIAGSHDVQFTNYVEDKSGTVKWMTDHPVMIADVRIDSRDFPKSVTRAAG
ncbi:endonuclease/exonuclease/phosphatase family protein [Marmoricola sp. RAF53]|uniref:endonuclease/exonuclease/phosphatase family protein n=1 Tax=Marmoricola sp. RAF53 TaxID=3233059 RepID=UPI003F962675